MNVLGFRRAVGVQGRGVRMRRSRSVTIGRHSREMRVADAWLHRRRAALVPYQIRSCVRCGHRTTFVREDAAGSWYFCIECGGYG